MKLQQLVLLSIQVSIFLTVFSYGLRARMQDLLYVVRRPWVMARSLLALFVIMPIAAVAIVVMFDTQPAVEIAVVAIALSPIPPLLPRRQVKASGRGSYALGLIATAALVSIVFIPPGVALVGRVFGKHFATDPGTIARVAILSVLAPLGAGMAFRSVARQLSDRIVGPMTVIANVLLALGTLGILIVALPAAIAVIGNGTILVLTAFIVFGLAVGDALGGREPSDKIVLAISTACRHPAIALAIAGAAYPTEKRVLGAVALYLLLNIVLSIPYVKWRQRIRPPEDPRVGVRHATS
jgi:BASS family bile acid:Na+ symporter